MPSHSLTLPLCLFLALPVAALPISSFSYFPLPSLFPSPSLAQSFIFPFRTSTHLSLSLSLLSLPLPLSCSLSVLLHHLVFSSMNNNFHLYLLLNVSLYLSSRSRWAAFLWMCGTQMYLVAPLESLQNNHNAN